MRRTTRAQRKWARSGMVPWWSRIFHRTPEGGWGLLEWRQAYRYGLRTYISPEEHARITKMILDRNSTP